jgi:hypothetical protein
MAGWRQTTLGIHRLEGDRRGWGLLLGTTQASWAMSEGLGRGRARIVSGVFFSTVSEIG